MGKSDARRRRRPRGSIQPEKIIDGAFELAEQDGLDNLSMPGLAAHLEMGVTSIYWHFRNREHLLSRMSDRAITNLVEKLPTPAGREPESWRSFLLYFCIRVRDLHRGDEVLTELTHLRTDTYSRAATHSLYRMVEEILTYLVAAGFTPSSAWHVYATLSNYLNGFVINEWARRKNLRPPEGRQQLELLEVDAMPLLSGLIESEDISLTMIGESSFEFGVSAILDSAAFVLQKGLSTAAAKAGSP